MVKRWRLMLILVLLLALAWLGYAQFVGWPTTPMTVERAERLFSEGCKPGQSVAEVKGWLAVQRIGRHYLRSEDGKPRGPTMDMRGNSTIAELAGIDPKTVYSYIRAEYPDAARGFLMQREVDVYLFFDAEGKLIKWWVLERIMGM